MLRSPVLNELIVLDKACFWFCFAGSGKQGRCHTRYVPQSCTGQVLHTSMSLASKDDDDDDDDDDTRTEKRQALVTNLVLLLADVHVCM